MMIGLQTLHTNGCQQTFFTTAKRIRFKFRSAMVKYSQTPIFLDKDIPTHDVTSLDKTELCEINGKRWVRGVDIYSFGGYLQDKIIFRGPFTIVKSSVNCPHCRIETPIVAIEAAGYVPCSGEGHDLALSIAFFLEGGLDKLTDQRVYVTYLQEAPLEFLKRVRMHSFLFRKYDFGDENEYFANACEKCKSPIDDFRIYYEADAPLSRSAPCPLRTVHECNYAGPLVVAAQFA